MKAWPYYGALFLPLLLAIALVYRGAWWFGVEIAAFVIVPLLDHLMGPDPSGPTRDDMKSMEAKWSYRIVLYLHVVAQSALLIACMFAWTSGALATWELVAMTVTMGVISGGLGITISHELVHRPTAWERWLGYLLLAEVWYMHFGLEHVRGHHRRVGTLDDPATARLNESSYSFLLRTITMSWISAFKMEPARVLGWFAIQAAWTTGAVFAFGDPTLFYFILGQALVAVLLLELVNYVEHYGLTRTVNSGVVERFTAEHAWESRYPASNYLLFKLQRHADHHMHPQRRYQVLRTHDESPQLPAGYPVMVMAALVPPLWKKLTHPRMPSAVES